MTSLAATPPLPVAAPVHPHDPALTAPDIGAAGVTAVTSVAAARHDPDRAPDPTTLPAPLKGLGIPPLNTRQVGDFDKIDDPPPPMGVDLPARLADLDAPPANRVDLRR